MEKVSCKIQNLYHLAKKNKFTKKLYLEQYPSDTVITKFCDAVKTQKMSKDSPITVKSVIIRIFFLLLSSLIQTDFGKIRSKKLASVFGHF